MNLIETLSEYLESLENAQKWTPNERQHNLDFYAQKIHQMYVDAVKNLCP